MIIRTTGTNTIFGYKSITMPVDESTGIVLKDTKGINYFISPCIF
nr:hypothetical protein [Mucilaginibacter sp. X4EP1]